MVEALLRDGTFTPRAVSRDPSSAASQSLKAKGAELVKADFSDKEAVLAAVTGSEAVFIVSYIQ